jgi:protein-disulfide isomerase
LRQLLYSRRRFGVALCASFVIAAILVTASQIGAGAATETKTDNASAAVARVPASPARRSPLAGIPQQGVVLGSPMARVTLVEYADLQCPYCGRWARETLPVLIRDYVRTGKLRIVFNGLAFLGPDSVKALRTLIAAGRQNHLWDLVHGLYARQGAENSGWVTDKLLTDVSSEIRGLDRAKMISASRKHWVEAEMTRAAAAAEAAGVTGTPSFQVGPTGGQMQAVQLASLAPDGIVPAIESALAQ